jgi:hypothetical protein
MDQCKFEEKQKERDDAKAEFIRHRDDSGKEVGHYHLPIVNCIKQYKEIRFMLSNPNIDIQKLHTIQNDFIIVIASDFQQSKLCTYWGRSSQPGERYYH